jgi:hypothetical protein
MSRKDYEHLRSLPFAGVVDVLVDQDRAIAKTKARALRAEAEVVALKAALQRAQPFVHWDFPPRPHDETCGDDACKHPLCLSAREIAAILANPRGGSDLLDAVRKAREALVQVLIDNDNGVNGLIPTLALVRASVRALSRFLPEGT